MRRLSVLCRLLQPAKAQLQIWKTLSGRTTRSSAVQPLKAFAPISVIPLPISTVRILSLKKAQGASAGEAEEDLAVTAEKAGVGPLPVMVSVPVFRSNR